MSHDIRTPINGIRGMVQIGNSYPDDPTKQKEVRRKIWEASDFLIDFVNDVMDMTKLESGEMTIEEKPFNLKDLMNSLVSVMDAQAKEQGITLTVDRMEGTHWDLIGSAVQVRRIFVSVIGNAIKYNQENGSVTLSLREISPSDSGRATYEFVCQDTGVGMSPEFQKKMFEQFTQENVIGEVAHHGTGLGLAIVKGLVREMDGTIRCKSEPNVGTTFTITLPFAVSAEAVAPAEVPQPRSEEESQKSLEGVSILLVEDNELNMEIAEFLLEDEGATITEAWNGQEALDLFSQSEPGEYQIILMDMMMPVMDGETATKAIRALDRADAKTIPILALTANAFNEDVQMALDIGMNAYLTKPIDSDQLKTEIRRFCPSGACA
jgi:CheY-like chemotaxis protein